MSSRARLPLGPAPGSLAEVLSALRRLAASLSARADRRGVFAIAYVHMTEALARGLRAGRFADPVWVERLAVRFAAYYLRALREHERGELHRIPRVWSLALSTSRRARGLVLQDLLLGVIAHIHHDLPLALADTLEGCDPRTREGDYFRALGAVAAAIDPIQEAVARAYAPGLWLLDRGFGRWDERATYAIVGGLRARAWRGALRLVERPSDREATRAALDREACWLSWLLLSPSSCGPVHRALRRVEAFNAERLHPLVRGVLERLEHAGRPGAR